MAGIGKLTPAGAIPTPLNPMRSQNLPPGMTAPSVGQMIYAVAVAGAGRRSSAIAAPQPMQHAMPIAARLTKLRIAFLQ